jgi:hypothetical protein
MENRKFPVKLCNKKFCDLNSSENWMKKSFLNLINSIGVKFMATKKLYIKYL